MEGLAIKQSAERAWGSLRRRFKLPKPAEKRRLMEIDIPRAKISIGLVARICAFSTTLECALSLGRVLSAATL